MSEFYKLSVILIPVFFVLVAIVVSWNKESFDERINIITSAFVSSLQIAFMLLTLSAIFCRLNPLILIACLIVEWLLVTNGKTIVKDLNRFIVMKQNK